MDFIRDILFGETDTPAPLNDDSSSPVKNDCSIQVKDDSAVLVENDSSTPVKNDSSTSFKNCPSVPVIDDILNAVEDSNELLHTIRQVEEVVDSADPGQCNVNGLKEDPNLLEDLRKSLCGPRQGWRALYGHLRNNRLRGADNENTNQTDEMKAQEMQSGVERGTGLATMMRCDWRQCDAALEELVERVEEFSREPMAKDEVLRSTDLIENGGHVFSGILGDVHNAITEEMHGIHDLKCTLNDIEGVLKENEKLKRELKALEERKRRREAGKDNKVGQFKVDVEEKVGEELARIRLISSKLEEDADELDAKNELLRRKEAANDVELHSLYANRHSVDAHYTMLDVKRQTIQARLKHASADVDELERKQKRMTRETQDLREKIDEACVENENRVKEFDETISRIFKAMDTFKAKMEEHLEVKVNRLKDVNANLTKNNRDLRCKILDKNVHGTLAALETKSPQPPQ